MIKKILFKFFLIINIVFLVNTGYADQSDTANSESEIEIKLDSKSIATSSVEPMSQRYLMGLGFASVLLLFVWILIKSLNKKKTLKHSPFQIKITNQYPLGPKKNLMMIEVAGEHLLIGVTDHNITLIKNLAVLDDDLPMGEQKSFKEAVSEVNSSKLEKFNEYRDDEFSVSQVRSLVKDKLSKMRNL